MERGASASVEEMCVSVRFTFLDLYQFLVGWAREEARGSAWAVGGGCW